MPSNKRIIAVTLTLDSVLLYVLCWSAYACYTQYITCLINQAGGMCHRRGCQTTISWRRSTKLAKLQLQQTRWPTTGRPTWRPHTSPLNLRQRRWPERLAGWWSKKNKEAVFAHQWIHTHNCMLHCMVCMFCGWWVGEWRLKCNLYLTLT